MPDLLAQRRGPLAAVVVSISLAAAGGIADASLQSRLDAAKQQAQALAAKIQSNSDRISSLQAQADAAQRKMAALAQVLGAGEQRSNQLATQLTSAQDQLAATTAQLHRAQPQNQGGPLRSRQGYGRAPLFGRRRGAQ